MLVLLQTRVARTQNKNYILYEPRKSDIYFISDTGPVLQIKTSCEKSASTKDELLFVFCQNGKCCSTGSIPAQKKKCKTNKYIFDNFVDCAEYKFTSNLIKGNVTYADLASARDRWIPEWVKMSLNDGSVVKCLLNGRIDGNDDTDPTFLDFECTPEGIFQFSVNFVNRVNY